MFRPNIVASTVYTYIIVYSNTIYAITSHPHAKHWESVWLSREFMGDITTFDLYTINKSNKHNRIIIILSLLSQVVIQKQNHIKPNDISSTLYGSIRLG